MPDLTPDDELWAHSMSEESSYAASLARQLVLTRTALRGTYGLIGDLVAADPTSSNKQAWVRAHIAAITCLPEHQEPDDA